MDDAIHIDTCAAHAGGRCNCGESLAALVDPSPLPAPSAAPSPSVRGALLLGAALLLIGAVWAVA